MMTKCACDRAIVASVGASQRHGLDLVGRPNQFRQPGENKTANYETFRT
jgi:hypothetical protein